MGSERGGREGRGVGAETDIELVDQVVLCSPAGPCSGEESDPDLTKGLSGRQDGGDGSASERANVILPFPIILRDTIWGSSLTAKHQRC